MVALLDGPRVLPRDGTPPKQLVIFLHGYGANGADLISLADIYQHALPNAAFVSPDAPDPIPGYPAGRQWFPLETRSPQEMATGVRLAKPALDAFITAEARRYDLPLSQVALIGFSQGTMMALHVGLRMADKLAAIVGFSGLLADHTSLAGDIMSKPPIFLAHGMADEVLPVEMTLLAATVLADAGCCPEFHLTPGLPHGIDPKMAEQSARFLSGAYAGQCAGAQPAEKINE